MLEATKLCERLAFIGRLQSQFLHAWHEAFQSCFSASLYIQHRTPSYQPKPQEGPKFSPLGQVHLHIQNSFTGGSITSALVLHREIAFHATFFLCTPGSLEDRYVSVEGSWKDHDSRLQLCDLDSQYLDKGAPNE
jgi:hypothetical protein